MKLVLENCTLLRGYNFGEEVLELDVDYLDGNGNDNDNGNGISNSNGKAPLLLFPGPGAISLDRNIDGDGDDEDVRTILDQLSQAQSKSSASSSSSPPSPSTGAGSGHLLILIDGTWAEARRIVMQSPSLVEKCQLVEFTSDYESIYDVVRKEPQKHCISTLEACAQALLKLEPDVSVAIEAKESLERSMRYMVDIKRRIYEERNNPEPRFTRPGMKEQRRSERAKEVEESIFGSGASRSGNAQV